jgi:hypothetical protein
LISGSDAKVVASTKHCFRRHVVQVQQNCSTYGRLTYNFTEQALARIHKPRHATLRKVGLSMHNPDDFADRD